MEKTNDKVKVNSYDLLSNEEKDRINSDWDQFDLFYLRKNINLRNHAQKIFFTLLFCMIIFLIQGNLIVSGITLLLNIYCLHRWGQYRIAVLFTKLGMPEENMKEFEDDIDMLQWAQLFISKIKFYINEYFGNNKN